MRRSTLILSLALAVSLAVNFLVAGLVLGHRWSGGPGPRHHQEGSMLFDRALAAVPHDLRRTVRERLRPEGADLRHRMQEVREAGRAANEALRQRPFDPVAAESALAALRERVGQAQSRLHDTIVSTMAEAQAAGTLPPPPERKGREAAGRNGGGAEDRPRRDPD